MGFAFRLAATGRERREFGQPRAIAGVKDRIRAALDTSGIPEKGRLYFLPAVYYLIINCFVMMPAFIGHNSTDIHPTTHLNSGSYGPNDHQKVFVAWESL